MYYIAINGAQKGPYPAEQIQAMLAAGEISPDTLAWTDGQASWEPVAGLVSPPQVPLAPAPNPVPAPAAVVGTAAFLGGFGTAMAIVGVILIALLAIGGGIVGYFVYVGSALDHSSKVYVDEAIPAIVTSWTPDQLVKRESKAFEKATSDQQLVRLFDEFRKLGPLKEYKGCTGSSNINYTGSGKIISAAYVGKATFANGDAEIRILLVQENGKWKIQGFRVNSPLFLK